MFLDARLQGREFRSVVPNEEGNQVICVPLRYRHNLVVRLFGVRRSNRMEHWYLGNRRWCLN